MSLPIQAPLQLEKLTDEELLASYCENGGETYILALWGKCADRGKRDGFYQHLQRKARHYCPPGYNPNWLFLGSLSRAYFRFKKYVPNYRGRLDTSAFEIFKKWIAKCSVIEEYRFVKGEGQAIWVQIGRFDVVDDTGKIIRPDASDEVKLWTQIDHARNEDAARLLADETTVEDETLQPYPARVPEDDNARDAESEDVANPEVEHRIEDILKETVGREPPPPERAGRTRGGGASFRSRRLLGIVSCLPRPDAALISTERKQIVRMLLLYHLTTVANADCMDEVVRFFYRQWTVAAIARWKYGEPSTDTVRDRHEKRIRDTLGHDLKSMRQVLKQKFNVTAFNQV